MPFEEQQARLEEAFDRIEETILPCIAMMLETLLDASEEVGQVDPKALAAELKILAAELEELLRDHRPPALEGEQRHQRALPLPAVSRFAAFAAAASSPKLSVAPCMRWMNTSSRPVSIRSMR